MCCNNDQITGLAGFVFFGAITVICGSKAHDYSEEHHYGKAVGLGIATVIASVYTIAALSLFVLETVDQLTNACRSRAAFFRRYQGYENIAAAQLYDPHPVIVNVPPHDAPRLVNKRGGSD